MRIRSVAAALAAVASFAACKASDLNINNPNSATVAGASADPLAVQLLATGLLADMRGNTTGYPQPLGIIGRESYTLTPTEGRNTTHYLIGISVAGQQKLDPSGFVTFGWAGPYNTMRDVYNFKNTIAANTVLTTAQKAAALGFAQTIEAYAALQVLATHDTVGMITEIKGNATELAPFVNRDSAYKYVIGTLNAGLTNLQAGGTAFAFTLHSGFNGFTTPATFAQFNRALAARAYAYYATSGGGATAWQAACARRLRITWCARSTPARTCTLSRKLTSQTSLTGARSTKLRSRRTRALA